MIGPGHWTETGESETGEPAVACTAIPPRPPVFQALWTTGGTASMEVSSKLCHPPAEMLGHQTVAVAITSSGGVVMAGVPLHEDGAAFACDHAQENVRAATSVVVPTW